MFSRTFARTWSCPHVAEPRVDVVRHQRLDPAAREEVEDADELRHPEQEAEGQLEDQRHRGDDQSGGDDQRVPRRDPRVAGERGDQQATIQKKRNLTTRITRNRVQAFHPLERRSHRANRRFQNA